MNAPTKALKQNNGLPSPTCTISQTISKKYFKIFKKANLAKEGSKKQGDSRVARKESFQSSLESKNREDVLKWFFSLDFAKRVKVCSIHNKFLGTILHQMHVHSDLDPRVKFQLRSVHTEDVEGDLYPIVYNNKSNSLSFVNVNVNNLSNFSKIGEASNINQYLNYFCPNSYIQTNIVINNYLKNNDNMVRDFLKEFKFYKCEEQNDTMILSSHLLTNEEQFKKFFAYFTNDKYFNKYIFSSYDQTSKLYHMHLPEWINVKEHYSFCQFLVAFFEQIILVWFFFSKNLDDQSFTNLLMSTTYEKSITELLEDSDKIVNFLKRTVVTNYDKRKLFEDLFMKNLTTVIRKDESIAEAISLKRRITENVHGGIYNNCYFHHPYERRSVSEILSELECHLRTNIHVYSEAKFVESLLFMSIDKIFTYEDFLYKKVYDEIHNFYTNQNALDLLNEEFSLDGNLLSSPKKTILTSLEPNKRKKNPKKNKKVKRYEKDESPSSSSEKTLGNKNLTASSGNNSINIKKNKEENIPELTCSLNSINVKSKSEESARSLVDFIIIKAIEYVEKTSEIFNENQCSQSDKTISNDSNENDIDTAYSSSNFSDEIKINPKAKNNKKKEKSNNFFLYTINPAHQKNNSRKNSKINESDKAIKLSSPKNEKVIKIKETPNPRKISKEIHEKENNSLLANAFKAVNQDDNKENQENSKIDHELFLIKNIKSDKLIDEKTNNLYENIIEVSSKENILIDKTNLHVKNKNISITINSPVYNNFSIINNSPNNFINNSSTRMMVPNLYNSNQPNKPFSQYPNFSSYTSLNSFNPLKQFMGEDLMTPNYNNIQNSQMFSSSNSFSNYKKFHQFNFLHNDIINYSRKVNENVALLKGLKLAVIKELDRMIKESLNEYNISLNLYGSFATNLEIESSDIDITVRHQSKNDEIKNNHPSMSYEMFNYSTEFIINKLVKTFKKNKLFESVNPISTASVPVIKLQVDLKSLLDEHESHQLNQFKNSDNFINYKFNKDELNIVRIDLTFMDLNKSNCDKLNTLESPSQQAVEYVKNSVLCFPEIRPLIHVLKRFLQIEKMNSTFNGGLSSFSLFLTIFAFLKMRKLNTNYSHINNLGNLLIEYLDFYSNFNFGFTFIDVNSVNPFIISNDHLEQIPLILDPTTYLNTGKSSFKIEEVKQIFIKGSVYLHNHLLVLERNGNLIYSLFDHVVFKTN